MLWGNSIESQQSLLLHFMIFQFSPWKINLKSNCCAYFIFCSLIFLCLFYSVFPKCLALYKHRLLNFWSSWQCCSIDRAFAGICRLNTLQPETKQAQSLWYTQSSCALGSGVPSLFSCHSHDVVAHLEYIFGSALSRFLKILLFFRESSCLILTAVKKIAAF